MHRIQDEYVQFAEHKQRKLDRQHIEAFDCTDVIPMLAPALQWPPWFYVCEARARCRVRHSSLGSGELLVSGMPGPAVGSGALPVVVSPVLVGRGLSSDSPGSVGVGEAGPALLGAAAPGPGVAIPGGASAGVGGVVGRTEVGGGGGGAGGGGGGGVVGGSGGACAASSSAVCTGACGADGDGEGSGRSRRPSGAGLAGLSSATIAASAACTASGGCGPDVGGTVGGTVDPPFTVDTLAVEVPGVCSLGGGSHALIASPLALPGSVLMREGLDRGVSGDGGSECSEGEGERRGAPPDLSLR